MKYSADYLIGLRREKWDNTHDIEYDKKLRTAIANEIIKNKDLRNEVVEYPEKLIELAFVVVDKNQKTLPFFLNEVQKEFIVTLNKAREDFEKHLISKIALLILKGRQQGFTTLITAYQEASSITRKNFQGFTLADKSSNAEAIFQNKAKFIHTQLPKVLKPTEKFNNKKQFLYEKLNSSWSVDTATKDVGRSRTVNFFHGSECAFWKDGIATIQAALGEAFTKNCIEIYESTARGYNDYQKMWASGEYINCFYEWWKTKEYRLNFPKDEIKQQFINNINTKDTWIFTRLKWLKEIKKLDLEQLYWYYKKYQKYIDKELIKQEYPCTPSEAFLLPGINVFNTEKILARIETLKKPIKKGYFIYDYDDTRPIGKKIYNIKWKNDFKNGYIEIYQLPHTPKITKYCIGGDTAGDGSDFYTGHVLDAKTGVQVARLKHQFDPHQYVRQMYCLGKYYAYRSMKKNEDALIGIEANFDTYPIMELLRLGYINQYIRVKVDEYTQKTEKRFGFKTTSITRPIIISRLIKIVDEDIESINDKDTLDELLTIVRNEKGRIEAPEGGHDDQMMGLAIAHQIREQVVFDFEEIKISPTYQFTFEKADSNIGDIGDKIEVV